METLGHVQLPQQAGRVVGAALAHGPAQHHGIEARPENGRQALAPRRQLIGEVKQRNLGPRLRKQGLQRIRIGPPNLVR